jgi:hypothetical protein
MSETSTVVPLHLHTAQSICEHLVNGTGVGVGAGDADVFRLSSEAARSILAWYANRQSKWGSPVQMADLEAIVDAIRIAPKSRLASARAAASTSKPAIFKIKRLTIHRFAGTHSYGTPSTPPPDLSVSFERPITLLEGGNGSGKTSIVNALTWCMSGLVLRPQRPPEEGASEYEVNFERVVEGAEDVTTQHQAALVTPLPNPAIALPSLDQKALFADTWVEAEFEDASGKSYSLRRELRTSKGRPKEVPPDLAPFALDPIAFRICTVMPAMIPYIKLGSASDLGRAVARLTGLSELTGLAKHANRASERASKDLRPAQEEGIRQENIRFDTARADLNARYDEFPALKPSFDTPNAAAAKTADVLALESHFQKLKAGWLASVQGVLGKEFNPNDAQDAADVERNIGPAFGQLDQLGKLKSAERLRLLGRLTDAELEHAEHLISELHEQAKSIAELASTTNESRRHQLYARIAGWLREGTVGERSASSELCVVCGTSLDGLIDPETHKPIGEHFADALAGKKDFVGQTISEWVRGAQGRLSGELPEALSGEAAQSLPKHPRDLIKSILLEELFDAPCFKGKLAPLKAKAEAKYAEVSGRLDTPLEEVIDEWPSSLPTLPVSQATTKLRRAIAYARWRKANVKAMQEVFEEVVGKVRDGEEETAERSRLVDHLSAIQRAVNGAAPIGAASILCGRLSGAAKNRDARQARIVEIDKAALALLEIAQLGTLVERQVDDLRTRLEDQTARWLRRIYRKTQSAAHDLVALDLSPTGQLGVLVGGGGMSAPAEQVANASALRATLLAFFFAFWEHVKTTRGGFGLLVLDDPQELLDQENKERFAHALPHLTSDGSNLLITTHDREFAKQTVGEVSRQGGQTDHRAVCPVNAVCSFVRLPLSEDGLVRKRKAFESPENTDLAVPAQEYASEVRTYVEAGLAGLFEEPAYAGPTHDLGLSDLIGSVRSKHKELSPFFVVPAVRQFCQSPVLSQGSAALRLLNKSHHPGKEKLTYMHVKEVAEDLLQVCSLVRNVQEEYRRWRKREPLLPIVTNALSLVPVAQAFRDLPKIATLSAFAGGSSSGVTGVEEEVFGGEWFIGKALMRLNTHNFGFAAPINSVVIVDCEAVPPVDRSLVVAGHGDKVYARRLLRMAQDPSVLALAAETVDPRQRPPTLLLPASEVAAHRVVGVLLDRDFPPVLGYKHEAKAVGMELLELSNVKVAFGVKDESALPLALPGQIVLGGVALQPTEFEKNVGQLVALTLDDGRQLFKRIGSALPAALSHIRQFESIGGYGESFLAATEEVEGRLGDFPLIRGCRLVVGVLYYVTS